MTIDGRRIGWLSDEFHREIREIMLHTLVRQKLACPIYCLMPDHIHILWIGLCKHSDQRDAAEFFRRCVGEILRRTNHGFQKQAYDNVLREKDREHDAVIRLVHYIGENPFRAGLVTDASQWTYSGSLIAGYPNMDWRSKDFTERFWKAYKIEVERREKIDLQRM